MPLKTDLRKVDCRLAVTDAPEYDREVFVRCPAHKDQGRPNCAVYPDHAHCYVCGFHIASRMETLAFLIHFDHKEHAHLISGTSINIPEAWLSDAFKKCRYYTNAELDAYRSRAAVEARKDPLPKSLAAGYHALLYGPRKSRLEWLYSRGISDLWIDRACLGHTANRFSIPIWDAKNNLINIRFRRDDELMVWDAEEEREPAKYSGMKGRNGTYFYPEWLVFSSLAGGRGLTPNYGVTITDWICVCEGELDALRLWSEGIPAVSPTNGANSVKQVAEFLKDIPQITRAYVCTDQDVPGDKAAEEFMSAASHLDYIERITWSPEYKDITEALQAGIAVPMLDSLIS